METDIKDLVFLVENYLKMPSLDGKSERQILRKQISVLIEQMKTKQIVNH